MNIMLLSGSFRQGSYNQALLEAVKPLLQGHTISSFPIQQLPFYADDLDGEIKPESVREFLDAAGQAEAIIIATPEFNHSIPAVLKNAIDWASRPAFNSPLKGIRATVMSASPSTVGGVHAQAHLKHILDSTLTEIYPAVAYTVPLAHEKFTSSGQLTDETALRRLERHITGFLDWVEK